VISVSRTHAAIAIAAGLALADASVVVLALPPILLDLDASIEAVAAVIGVYTLALAIGLFSATRSRRIPDTVRLGALGMLCFALASAGCGLAPNMVALIASRAVQGVAAAAVLLAAFDLLDAGRPDAGGRRLWTAAAILGAAIGPALGGTLTQLLDWRAIFLVQAPVVAIAALICLGASRGAGRTADYSAGRESFSVRALCLGLVSAALIGVLFLLVLLLVSGWALSPLAAAAVVSVLPLAALLGMRVPWEPGSRAIVGCALVGAGVLSLAFLPVDAVAMTIAPQVVAGIGMGMALPALAGGLLRERSAADAGQLLFVRHLGITLALLILAPIAAAQLDDAAGQVRERGTALILDADLPVREKLDLADVATADLSSIAPRDALRSSLQRARRNVDPEDLEPFDRLKRRADETLVTAVNDAFAPTFLICGALALVAAAALLVSMRTRLHRAPLAACAVAAALIPAQAGIAAATKPDAVVIADPCKGRPSPDVGGFEGLLQGGALALLDATACRLGSSREELALALVDEEQARAFKKKHGVDPRSLGDLLPRLLR
jgi:Major Facilitator Superfamily